MSTTYTNWILFLLITIIYNPHTTAQQHLHKRPNFIIFLTDDMGYGDLSTYGHPTQEAGPVDRMAREGLKLTQAYAAAPVCTPSRAALLTGRQPFRTGMVGPELVHVPEHRGGLSHEEITLASALKQQGYRTGMVGKWHLGINNQTSTDGAFLPQTHGFDYVGTFLPFSLNIYSDIDKRFVSIPYRQWSFVYRDRDIIQQPIDLTQLTAALVHDAKAFLYDNSQDPFFFYFSFPQVHTAMFNMPQFKGSSQRGIFGDQVNEMSWAVGEVMRTLEELGLSDNTLSVFTSDHGPHLEMCHWGGSAGAFSGGKLSFCEGGLRVPGIVHWPGVIQPGSVSSHLVSLMDIFPTFLQLAGVEPPQDRIIDGKSFVDLISKHSLNVKKNSFEPNINTQSEKLVKTIDTKKISLRVCSMSNIDIKEKLSIKNSTLGKKKSIIGNYTATITNLRPNNCMIVEQKPGTHHNPLTLSSNVGTSHNDRFDYENSSNNGTATNTPSSMTHRALFIYDTIHDMLTAVRYKQYKVYLASFLSPHEINHTQNCDNNGEPIHDIYYTLSHIPEPLDVPVIYNVENDPAEEFPLLGNINEDIMGEIQPLLEYEKTTWLHRQPIELKKSVKNFNIGPCCNPPFCVCQSKKSLSSYGICNQRATVNDGELDKSDLMLYVATYKLTIVVVVQIMFILNSKYLS